MNYLFISNKANNDTDLNHRKREYNFTELCTKRVHKCAIEGGIFRRAEFQSKLLNHTVCYKPDDPKFMYLDYEIMDGASMQYLFSNNRTQVFNTRSNELCITDVRFVRMRFDLLSETPQQAERSIKFMNTFVEFFQSLERNFGL